MHNAIYTGLVTHNRLMPKAHKFAYKMQMFFVAYNEINNLIGVSKLLSINKFNVVSFDLKNYLSKESVIKNLQQHGYTYTADNICILTHLSYMGLCYNPVSFYYCYDASGDKLEYMLTEINNTPWNERFVYCFDCRDAGKTAEFVFAKRFHISPFMPMGIQYHWYFYQSAKKINIIMRSFTGQDLCFTAALQLKKHDINSKTVNSYIFRNMFVPHMILLRIYWHALILWFKRTPFFSHPRNSHG